MNNNNNNTKPNNNKIVYNILCKQKSQEKLKKKT